jgi:hypothetical protein
MTPMPLLVPARRTFTTTIIIMLALQQPRRPAGQPMSPSLQYRQLLAAALPDRLAL